MFIAPCSSPALNSRKIPAGVRDEKQHRLVSTLSAALIRSSAAQKPNRRRYFGAERCFKRSRESEIRLMRGESTEWQIWSDLQFIWCFRDWIKIFRHLYIVITCYFRTKVIW